jgi:hypothetical protein
MPFGNPVLLLNILESFTTKTANFGLYRKFQPKQKPLLTLEW